MKSMLAKIAMRRFVGLHLGEHEVSVSEVAVTPLGPIEVASHTEPCPPNELLNSIERALQSLQGNKRRRLQVAIGLPNSRVFFGTRPLRGAADPSAEGLLQKLLCSANISTEDLTIDMIKSTVEKVPVGSVASCRKKYMAAVLGVLEQCGALAIRAEPSPCALVRAAAQRHRPPRRAKTLLYIFLGAGEGLAVLTVGGLSLAWRSFALPSFSEGMAILSSARTLLSQNKFYGMETTLNYAIVLGRPDLHERLQKEGLPTEIGARMIWHEEPAFDSATAALGLALGCVNQGAPAFDLAQSMKPQPSLRDIFPWGELACECAIMAFMALMFVHENENVRSACRAVQMQCEGNKVLANSNAPQLEREKGDLAKKIDSLQKFFDGRVVWTNYTRNIPASLPDNIIMRDWHGESPLVVGGRNVKSMMFSAEVALTSEGAVPPEVNKLLVSMRKNPVLTRDFPQTNITSIRLPPGMAPSKGGKPAIASFTIVSSGAK